MREWKMITVIALLAFAFGLLPSLGAKMIHCKLLTGEWFHQECH